VLKGRSRLLLVVGLAVTVAVVAAVVVLVVVDKGTSGYSGPSAAQLYSQQARFGKFGPYIPGSDPDETDRGGNNVDDVVRDLGNGRYQLTVQNVGFLGYINGFSWNAPNIAITKVTGSTSGSCTASPDHNVVTQYGTLPTATITCTGMAIAPPKCSCRGGGTATVSFTGHPLVSKPGVVYGVVNSRLVLGDMTLVPYHIPSYLGGAGNTVDLPLCAKGQQSSKAHLCVHPN
jgi:hypothetical protein